MPTGSTNEILTRFAVEESGSCVAGGDAAAVTASQLTRHHEQRSGKISYS